MFPEKLKFENGEYRTLKPNLAFGLTYWLSSDVEDDKTKQAGKTASLSTWAPLNVQSCNYPTFFLPA
jgi:hypothetical protein